MADPALVDFATAFAAIQDGSKVMRRQGWLLDAGVHYRISQSESENSDPMLVLVDGPKQTGYPSVLVTDLLKTDWIVEAAPAPPAPPPGP